MSNENNKMQVDIDNLFKQNVNDLSSIKELYKKLKEIEEKISQIKYIDTTLSTKLKKDYEKLKRVILDENVQALLYDNIEKTNIRIDNFIVDLNKKIKNINKQTYKSIIGVNMWFRDSTTDSYINEVLDDMIRLKIKSLLIPCHNIISGDDIDGYTYTKNVTESQINNLVNKAREKGIEDIIIKLHREGVQDTSSLNWINMWKTVVNEYIQICKRNNITSLVFVNEQRNATANNLEKWYEIISTVKNNGLKAICSLADFSEFESSIINGLVDVIGINHYPKLINKNENVTQEEYNKRLFNNSIPQFKRIKKLYPYTPLWITEIGCTRNIDALYSPASWEFDTDTQSKEPQALFVDSVMSTFGCYDNNLFEKVYWWSTDYKTKVNTFTFFGNEKAECKYSNYLGGE